MDELALLKEAYPDAKHYLEWDTPFHLVVATILSAQCTDVVVNSVTKSLFPKYPDPQSILAVSEEDFAKDIERITFYKNKARMIQKTCHILLTEFDGEVPRTIAELTKLSGVARKSANAIQQNAFGIVEGITVDTHVIRLANRLGWTREKDPVKIERDLMNKFAKADWKSVPILLKTHGKKVCTARKPACANCILNTTCPSAFKV